MESGNKMKEAYFHRNGKGAGSRQPRHTQYFRCFVLLRNLPVACCCAFLRSLFRTRGAALVRNQALVPGTRVRAVREGPVRVPGTYRTPPLRRTWQLSLPCHCV